MSRRVVGLAACVAVAAALSGARADPAPAPVRLFPFHDGGTWGYINSRGEVVIPPRFVEALDFVDGLARVQTGKGIGYIDGQGNIAFLLPDAAKPLDWTRPFAGGRAAFSVGGKCGYFDRQGKVLVEPKYDDVREFAGGLAAVNVGAKSAGFPRPSVRTGGTWGFIDTTGRLVIPPRFSYVDVKGFSDGLARVSIDDATAYIDKTGKVAIRPEFKSDDPKRWIAGADTFSDGLARVNTSGYEGPYTGFIDRTGTFAIAPRLDGAGHFAEGVAAVLVGKKYGYMDKTGRVVIAPQFDTADRFSEGLAVVGKGDHLAYIDRKGTAVIQGRYNDAEEFRGGLARVHEGGEFVVAHDGPAAWTGGAWYYVDPQGRKVRRCCTDGVPSAPGYGRESR